MIDQDGNTILHRAVIDGLTETAAQLISQSQVDPNQKNFLGYTPLQLARFLGRSECLALLGHQAPPCYYLQHKEAQFSERVTEKKFGEVMQISPLTTLCFLDYQTLRRVTLQVKDGLERDQIADEAHWVGTLFQKEILEGEIPNVTISWINPNVGYGVFANQDFKSGSFLGIYSGYVKPLHWYQIIPNDYCFRYPTRHWAWRRYTIDAEKSGNHTRYINHSSQPNLECLYVYTHPLLYLVFRSICDIKKGSQLLFDYGPEYWKHRKTPQHL